MSFYFFPSTLSSLYGSNCTLEQVVMALPSGSNYSDVVDELGLGI